MVAEEQDRDQDYLFVSLSIDHCTVSIAILDVGQSQKKLQQMYGKFFNYRTLQLHNYKFDFDEKCVFKMVMIWKLYLQNKKKNLRLQPS